MCGVLLGTATYYAVEHFSAPRQVEKMPVDEAVIMPGVDESNIEEVIGQICYSLV